MQSPRPQHYSMKKLIIPIAVVVAGASATFFIIKSNDHKECSQRSYQTVNEDGSVTTHTEHICKEKFSF